ncbi:MAG: DUF4365 domain-containing protein [Deltaproteobacteria bacterium]|nr:DUF4365 domain-containing protein [Deltaproteobacteria bacterium]
MPKNWIVRTAYDDYGIDCEIEIVDADGSVTGALLKCQIKGTERLSNIRKKSVKVKTSTVQYWLALPVPVILILVVYPKGNVFWLNVREYLLMKDQLDNLYSTKQKTFTFSFRDSNILPGTWHEMRDLAVEHSAAVLSWLEGYESDIKSQFIAYYVLIAVFDGNPDKWLKWIREKGTEETLLHDVPLVLWIKSQISEDPDFLNRIRNMVNKDM